MSFEPVGESVPSPFRTRIKGTRVFGIEEDKGEGVYWVGYLPEGETDLHLARITYSELKTLEERGEVYI